MEFGKVSEQMEYAIKCESLRYAVDTRSPQANTKDVVEIAEALERFFYTDSQPMIERHKTT